MDQHFNGGVTKTSQNGSSTPRERPAVFHKFSSGRAKGGGVATAAFANVLESAGAYLRMSMIVRTSRVRLSTT
jgi:hypothetical protein